MNENDAIDVTWSFEKLLAVSTAPYILKVVYKDGATVRAGVEIEGDELRHISQGEIVEAFSTALTRADAGTQIVRFQIADGWISKVLRGKAEEKVVQILRELPSKPVSYLVTRGEGAKLRAASAIDSEDLGFVPQNTTILVAEKRLEFDASSSPSETRRIRIVSPAQYAGWISEKGHIVNPIEEEFIDAELNAELDHRLQVRLHRSHKGTSDAGATNRRLASGTGSLDVSSETLFLLNGSQRGSSGITISSDFKTVTCEGGGGRAMVLGSRGFTRGVHYWEVQVDSSSLGSVFIGVAPAESQGSSSWPGYGLVNYRATQQFGNETMYGKYFGMHPAGFPDTIGVLLDMDHGTISFFKEGKDPEDFLNPDLVYVVDMGVAYHNLRRNNRSAHSMLYPCLGVKQNGDRMSIRKCKWMSCKGLGTSALLNRVLQAKGIVSVWRNAYLPSFKLSERSIDEFYASYKRWRAHDKHVIKSRPGLEVAVDMSIEAIERALGEALASSCGLRAGKKFQSQFGDGHIIGARYNQLWWVLESGESDAWYWTREEFRDLLDTGELNFGDEESKSEDEKPPTMFSLSQSHEPLPILTIEEFTSILISKERSWSLDEDAAITLAVNTFSDKYGVDPLRIFAEDLESYRSTTNVLKHRSAAEVQARYSCLCVLNRASSVALPHADFGLEDSRASSVTTEFELDLTSKLGFRSATIADASTSGSSVKSLLTSASSRTLLEIKRVLFTQTKLKLWKVATRETTSVTVPASDEYDRPEGFPEVTLNRITPRSMYGSKESFTFNERLHDSVFGQLMDAMNSWDDRQFRKSFVAIRNAGQARAFYVKFSGEGVDDNGGPYRAAFHTSVSEESVGFLDLFVPCPNAQGGSFENRERMVFNASLMAAPERHVLYSFLGKLISMANRHNIQVPLFLPNLVWKPLVGEVVTKADLEAIDSFTINDLAFFASGEVDTELLFAKLQGTWQGAADTTTAQPLTARSLFENDAAPAGTTASSSMGGGGGGGGESGGDGDGGVGEIGADGSTMSAARIKRICDLILHMHLTSQSTGIAQLHRGMAAVVPAEIFPIFSAIELEVLFCGAANIDLDVLKKATVYEGVSPSDPHIKLLWEALETLTQEERSSFINFCSGMSRLPASANNFPMSFKLIAPGPKTHDDPDAYLPIAQTCFFQVSNSPSLSLFLHTQIIIHHTNHSAQHTRTHAHTHTHTHTNSSPCLSTPL